MKQSFFTKVLVVAAGTALTIAGGAASAEAADFLSTSNGQVGTIDPATGLFSALPTATPPFTDLALSESGDLFGVTFQQFFSIDKTTGASTSLGLTFANLNALGFSTTNDLYAAGDSGFYKLSLATGFASLIADIPGFSSSGDIVFDPVNNRFLATSAGDSLFSITPTGSATNLGAIGFSRVYGLFFEGGTLYGYTADGKQIIIDPTTGAGTFDRNVIGLQGSIYGAASLPSTGPIESVPEPATILGLLTAGALGTLLKRQSQQKASFDV